MRNLKKLLAVVLTVVMIASMMVPALAANTYEAEALKLQSIGMFAGEPADLKLEEGVTRIQGLAFAIRAAGVEADAFAMTDEEVATILDTYVDGADVPEWGRKYAAYAIKNGITVGVSATEKKFAALDPISGTSFLVFLMKAGMGYADVTTATVVEASVEAGILTAGQAAQFGAKAALIRDDAAGILYGAAMNGVNADGTPLIEALIASGFVDRDAALEAGFVEEVVPEELEVVSVTANNLMEIVVEFNQQVDEDSAEKLSNYKLDNSSFDSDDDKAELQEDGKTVVITLLSKFSGNGMDNQKSYKLKVDGVKSADESQKVKDEVEFTAFDTVIPVAESVEVTGPKSIKVNFSEPLKTQGNYKVDNGNYYASTSSFKKGDKSVEITIGVKFTEGSHKVVIENATDFYGFKVAKTTLEFDFVIDDEAPIVTIDKVTETKITLKFSKPVKASGINTDVTAYYGYNKDSQFRGTLAAVDADNGYSDTYTVTFTRPIPAGSHILYLNTKANKLEDKWGNDVDSAELAFSVEVDNVKPEVVSVVAEKDNKIIVTFSEDVNKTDALRKSYYTLKDSDGKVIKTAKFADVDNSGHFTKNAKLSYDADDYAVTIKLTNNLEGGSYILEIKNIRDISYSKNTMDDASISFDVEDTTGGGLKSALVNGDGSKIRVFFAEAMSEEGLTDIDNYRLIVDSGAAAELHEDSKITIIDSKTVEIELGVAIANVNGTGDFIQASGNLTDVSGNKMSGFFVQTAIAADTVTKTADDDGNEVVFTSKTEFEVFFGQELKEIDASKVTVDTGGAAGVDNAFFTNDSGKSTVTVVLDDELSTDANEFLSVEFAAGALTNVFGTKNDSAITLVKADMIEKIAPEVDSIKTTGVYAIVVYFSEDMNDESLSKYTFTVEGNTVTGVSAYSFSSLTLLLKDAIETDDTPDVTLALDVEDASGNVLEAGSDMPDTDDEIAPTVINLGDGTAPVSIAAGGVAYLEFSEELDEDSMDAIIAAIEGKASTPNTLDYSWGRATLTITNDTSSAITFTSDVKVTGVKDLAGNSVDLLVINATE